MSTYKSVTLYICLVYMYLCLYNIYWYLYHMAMYIVSLFLCLSVYCSPILFHLSVYLCLCDICLSVWMSICYCLFWIYLSVNFCAFLYTDIYMCVYNFFYLNLTVSPFCLFIIRDPAWICDWISYLYLCLYVYNLYLCISVCIPVSLSVYLSRAWRKKASHKKHSYFNEVK